MISIEIRQIELVDDTLYVLADMQGHDVEALNHPRRSNKHPDAEDPEQRGPIDTEGYYLIPVAALTNRMRGYSLATPEEALEAIMREHGFRIGELEPEGDELHHQLGGLHSDVSVEHKRDSKKQLAAALESLNGKTR